MEQVNLCTKPSNAGNTRKQRPFIQGIIFAGVLLVSTLFAGSAFAQPSFIGGTPQSLVVCENSGPNNFGSLLTVNDPTVGATLNWVIFIPPSNGTLSGLPATATTTGGIVTVGPVTYTPNPGFSGTESFVISASDGISTAYTAINVTVNPLPAVSPIDGISTVCLPGGEALSDATAGGTWGVTNSNATIDALGNLTSVSAGMDTVLYSATNGCGTTTDSMVVTISTTPSAGTITGPTNGCPGTTVTLSDSIAGGIWTASNGYATVTIGGGDVTGVTPGSTSPEPDTISYTVSLSCGVATATFVYTVDPLPSASAISGPTSVCAGLSITLTDPIPGGFWNVLEPDSSGVISSTGIFYGLFAQVDTVIYTVINDCGSANVIYTVTINPLPVSGTVSGPLTVCQGSTITLTDAGSAPIGLWSATNGHGTISATGVVTGVTGGIDTFIYVSTNVCGHDTSRQVDTIHALAVAGTITGLPTVCVDASITLTDPLAAPAGIWTIKNANATISAGGVVTGVTAGLDTIKYTVTNVCNSVIATYPITVNPLPFAGHITGPTSVCAGTADTIILADTVLTGVWSSPAASVYVNSTSGHVTGLSKGIAIISYAYTNVCGSDTVTHIDTVNVLPDSGYISGPVQVCMGSVITLVDTNSGGVWTSSGTMATVSSAGLVSGVATGIDTLKYTVTGVCGSTTARYPVNVITVPSPGTITGDTSICPDVFVQLSDTAVGGVWSIDNADTSVALLDASGVVSGKIPGHVTITYTVTNICGTTNTTFGVTIVSYDVCHHVGVAQVAAAAADVTIFPNPATDELTIKTEDGAYNLFTVTNEIGQVVMKQALTARETTVNVHSFSAGIYNITLSGANGVVTKKLVKD